MQFASRLFGQRHLSDDVLAAAVASGDRPSHLDSCEACASRAREVSRWLEDVRADALTAADAVFTPDRLEQQQAQILRRIQQLDEPVRVLEFPKSTASRSGASVRRVSAGWLGVAAAAGLALGVVGGHFSARLDPAGGQAAVAAAPTQAAEETVPNLPGITPLGDWDIENVAPATWGTMSENAVRVIPVQFAAR